MKPRFLDAGEAALVVEFGAAVDPSIHDRVLALDAALNVALPRGVSETVPTYRSLMVHYDPLQIERAALVAQVSAIEAAAPMPADAFTHWTAPCCYDAEFGEDIG